MATDPQLNPQPNGIIRNGERTLRVFKPRAAYPPPGPGKLSIKPTSVREVVRSSAKMASSGWQVSTGTELGRIRDQALKTVGYDSVLWLRQQIELDRSVMEFIRSTFVLTWFKLGKVFSPRRGRFLESDVNQGYMRNFEILDDTGGQAKDVLAAGMLAGISSPSQQWFMLTSGDTHLDENQSVKEWCFNVSQRMASVFQRSNLYEELPLWYEDSATFAIGMIWMAESLKDTVTFKCIPIGSYMVQHTPEGRVETFYRSYMMTVAQILKEFGQRNSKGEITNWEHFSQAIRSAHDNKTPHYTFYVGHYIRPNHEYEPEAPGTQGFPFLEVYFERGQVNQTAPGVSTTDMGSEQWRFLRVRGLMQMPIMELIWKKTGEDDYGTECPGIRSFGDARQLQAMVKRTAQAAEKGVNPAMQGPSTMKGQRVSILPGDLTTYDQRPGEPGFRPAHEVKYDFSAVGGLIQEIRGRMQAAWYFPLFMMLQQLQENGGKQPITAEQVREMKAEKLLMLGPLVQKASRNGFTPLIEFTFRAMLQAGLIPPVPEALKGRALAVDFTSIFAQALKMASLEALKDFTAWVLSLVEALPGILDVVDADELIRQYADMVEIPPTILREAGAVSVIRNQRAKAQQAQAQAQAQQQQAETANKLAGASTDPKNPNALTEMMQQAQSQNLVQQ